MQIVLATTARTRGGVWRHIEDLGTGLQRAGHEVVVGLAPEAHELEAAAGQAGLATAEHARTVRWRGWIWHGHLHDTFERALLTVPLRRRRVGPTVLTEHLPHTNASDPRLQPGKRTPLAAPAKTLAKRLQYGSTGRVIAVSPSSRQFLVARYGRRVAGRIEVVQHGIAASSTPPLAQHAGPPRILSVGSVIQQKGHDQLVDAADREPRPAWRATVLGDGPAREALSRRAEVRGVVSFPGWSDAVADEIAAADVVCLPSRWESAGYAALEAMAAGRPVVASAVDGLRDVIDDEVSGLLVPAGDVDSLRRALDRLAADPGLRLELGEQGRRRAGEFTIDRMVAETLRVYAGVA
jgi:glycosyltransferase involved in cell wall biosynthesis